MLYLPVEVKARELHGKLLLAYHALLRGDSVILGEHSKVEEAARIYPTGIFLCKGYPSGYMKRVVVGAKQAGHVIVNLDEEGLIYTDESIYLKTRMNRKWVPYHDYVYCWGARQQRMIEEEYPALKGRCLITGNPRFDLLTSKYRRMYQKEADQLKKTYGPYIMVNTRFSLYNTIKGKKENGLTPQARYIRDLYSHFVCLIKRISQELPDKKIILRPHPSESKNSYKEDLKGYGNVLVKDEGAVIPWIMGAEALIHNGCTTGIEGYLLGRPVYSYEPVTSPLYDVPLPRDVSVAIKDLEALVLLLKDKTVKKRNPPSLLMDSYGNLGKEEYAYKNILNQMRTINSPLHAVVPSIPYRYQKDKRRKIRYLFPSLSKGEIQTFFQKVNEVEQNNLVVQIIPLSDRLFLMTAEQSS
ncbi:surface carbohydrate biosynthesis protein [Halobacillus sp. SY10]|uniref:surface carbohydrate biosynthesis protein n=1 Tax=Halobacillus sp. SY10 TaxID=3381356 RepID=UPI0038790BE7